MPEELFELLQKNKEICRQLKAAISQNENEAIWLLDAELDATVESILHYEPRNKDEALRVLNTMLDWLTVEKLRTQRDIEVVQCIQRLFEVKARLKA